MEGGEMMSELLPLLLVPLARELTDVHALRELKELAEEVVDLIRSRTKGQSDLFPSAFAQAQSQFAKRRALRRIRKAQEVEKALEFVPIDSSIPEVLVVVFAVGAESRKGSQAEDQEAGGKEGSKEAENRECQTASQGQATQVEGACHSFCRLMSTDISLGQFFSTCCSGRS